VQAFPENILRPQELSVAMAAPAAPRFGSILLEQFSSGNPEFAVRSGFSCDATRRI
jgi:hypothetical protein